MLIDGSRREKDCKSCLSLSQEYLAATNPGIYVGNSQIEISVMVESNKSMSVSSDKDSAIGCRLLTLSCFYCPTVFKRGMIIDKFGVGEVSLRTQTFTVSLLCVPRTASGMTNHPPPSAPHNCCYIIIVGYGGLYLAYRQSYFFFSF